MIGLVLAAICIVDAVLYAMEGRFYAASFMLVAPIIWTYAFEMHMKRAVGK